MAGTVISSRITDKDFYFTRRNVASGGVLKDNVFDVSKTYNNGWKPAVQQTTSFRSGKGFSKALSDPQQSAVDEDLLDLQRAQGTSSQFLESFSLPAASKYDRGHPFATIKIVRELPTVGSLRSIDGLTSYYGPIGLFYPGCGLNTSFDGSVVLDAYPAIVPNASFPSIDVTRGVLMINKTIPTLPVAGAAAFLGELHEGLPRLIGHSSLFRERGHAFHGLGSEYLNVQFGWKPFVSDVKDFAKAFKNAGKILAQYRRDSGKTVHRHWQLPPMRDVKVYPEYQFGYGTNAPSGVIKFPADNSVYGNFSAPEINSLMVYGRSGSAHASSVLEQKYKFSGAYSYLLSEDDSFFGRMERYVQEADKLLGIRLTPEVLWQLTPWSWLADWEVNIGVNISNMTALGQDSLALRWGYLMRETHFNHYTSTSVFPSYGGFERSIHSTWRITKKERIRSTPFGFGRNPAEFTTKQWAILGALGMTRAPRSLF